MMKASAQVFAGTVCLLHVHHGNMDRAADEDPGHGIWS